MGDFKMGNNTVLTQSGTAKPTFGSGVPTGTIIKTTAVVNTGSTVEATSTTQVTAVNADYTCVSSSNKILLMGIGVVSRGSQNGQTGYYYFKDSTQLEDYENRNHNDNDDVPIGNWYLDGHSGSVNFSLKISSLSNNNKVQLSTGSGFLIMEIAG